MSTESKKIQAGEGKYTLMNFTMSTKPSNEVLNLTNMAVTCEIFESILSPSAIMKIKLYDATGAFTSFIWDNQEVCISFTTNSRGAPIHYKMVIVEQPKAEPVSEGKGIVFELICVSKEAQESSKLTGFQLTLKKIEADIVVSALLEGALSTEKKVYYDKTKGLRNYTFNKVTPFDAIHRVTKAAMSDKYDSHAFVFYENHKGYWFKCIESLIEEGKKNIGDKVYINSSMTKTDSTGSNWRNIIAYSTISQGSQKILLAIGGNKITIQLQPRGVPSSKWPPPEERSSKDFEFVTLNPGSAVRTQETEDKNTTEVGSVLNVPYDPEEESDIISEKLAANKIYLSQLFSVVQHINVYGDSEVTCGDVINCRFLEPTGTGTSENNPKPLEDPVLSGNYLVTKCRHSLTFGDSPEYYQALEIVKDGIVTSLQPLAGK